MQRISSREAHGRRRRRRLRLRLNLHFLPPPPAFLHSTRTGSIPKTSGRHDFSVKMFGYQTSKFLKCGALIQFHLLFISYFKGAYHVHCIIMPPRRFHAKGCAQRNAGGGGKKYARESIIQSVDSNPGVFGAIVNAQHLDPVEKHRRCAERSRSRKSPARAKGQKRSLSQDMLLPSGQRGTPIAYPSDICYI